MDSMTKHLTCAEKEARKYAEAEVMPTRRKVELKKPEYIRGDKKADQYWKKIVKEMDGVDILDNLDSEVLGIYCSMLSRRDRMDALCSRLMEELGKSLEGMGELDSLMGKIQAHEKTILTYAEKLGLTPSGRVHLARKRAVAVQSQEETDLFGE